MKRPKQMIHPPPSRVHAFIDEATLFVRRLLCFLTCGAIVTESRVILPRHAALVAEAAARSAEIYGIDNAELISDEETDAQAMIVCPNRVAKLPRLVVFRGSQSTRDWIMNVAYRFSSPYETIGEGVRCHTGFLKQWTALRPVVLDALDAIAFDEHIVCTGHSLGGGVATLAALELSMAGFTNIDLITFGSPRVFNSKGVEHFKAQNIRSYRVKNGADIVSVVPIIRMCHVCEASCVGTSFLLYSVRNHNIDDYAHILRAYATRVSGFDSDLTLDRLRLLERAMHNPTIL